MFFNILQRKTTRIVDHYHEWYAKDCCFYPDEVEVMKCLREEVGNKLDENLMPADVHLYRILRERRNRRAGYIRDSLKFWEIGNTSLEPSGT